MTSSTELAVLLAQLAQVLATQEPQPPQAAEMRSMPERILLKVEEAAERLGIGRTTAYRLVRSGELESVRIGSLRRVSVMAINEYAARLVTRRNVA